MLLVQSLDVFEVISSLAEYENEEEERVRWLFIGILEIGVVEVWSYS